MFKEQHDNDAADDAVGSLFSLILVAIVIDHLQFHVFLIYKYLEICCKPRRGVSKSGIPKSRGFSIYHHMI